MSIFFNGINNLELRWKKVLLNKDFYFRSTIQEPLEAD